MTARSSTTRVEVNIVTKTTWWGYLYLSLSSVAVQQVGHPTDLLSPRLRRQRALELQPSLINVCIIMHELNICMYYYVFSSLNSFLMYEWNICLHYYVFSSLDMYIVMYSYV